MPWDMRTGIALFLVVLEVSEYWVPLNELGVRQDLLDRVAKATSLAMISVEYRLAPEHPFPAGPEDAYDVAEYLVNNSDSVYGGPLKFIGAESAGATLSVLAVSHLLATRPDFALAGTVLFYGLFNLSLAPSECGMNIPLVMTASDIDNFLDAYLPNTIATERRNPAISPIYHEIFRCPNVASLSTGTNDASGDQGRAAVQRGNLPPAMFIVGTLDCVVDDQILMSFKW